MWILISLLSYFLLVNSSLLSCSSYLCPESNRILNYCDPYCNTELCNFGQALPPSDLEHSPCYKECITSTACSEILLYNDACDDLCNNSLCGFDNGKCGFCAKDCRKEMLGDAKCDSACKNPECGFDLDDCLEEECEARCKISKLNDKTCNKECQTDSCMNDLPDCSPEEVCQYPCIHYKSDGFEDYQCNKAACEYDGGDYDCSAGCTSQILNNKTNVVCDESNLCNTPECNWHQGYCGDCGLGCYKDMLGNGKCEPKCYNQECGYDSVDCKECAPGCAEDLLGTCNLNCLTLSCSYDSKCSDLNLNLRTLAKYTQILQQDYNYILNTDISSMCIQSNLSKCSDGCNIEECAYCLGNCISSDKCSSECKKCYGENNGQCFECLSTNSFKRVQFFGYCLNECPYGFKANSASICISDDTSSPINSINIYVSSTQTSSGLGTSDTPFSKLSEALARANFKHTILYLSKGLHEYSPIVETSLDMLAYTKTNDPLNKSGINQQSILITPWIVLDELTEETRPVIRLTAGMSFTLSGNQQLTISNITLEGNFNLTNPCIDIYCSYFPYMIKIDDLYYDQHQKSYENRNEIPNSKVYFDHNLFILNDSSVLNLNNVSIQHFRMEFYSLIMIRNQSEVNMKNVEFYNIKVSYIDLESAVIVIKDCNEDNMPYNCGRVNYQSGIVKYLNNGFEIHPAVHFPSFIYAKNANLVSLDGVRFEYNIILNTKDTSQGLINMNRVRNIVISNCSFHYNVLSSGILNVMDFSISDVLNNEQALGDHNITHVDLNTIEIGNSYSENALLMNAVYRSDLQNVLLSDIKISDSLSNSLLNINAEEWNQDNGKAKVVTLSKISSYTLITKDIIVQVPRKCMILDNIYISSTTLGNHGIIYSKNYDTISISNLHLDNSSSQSLSISDSVLNFFIISDHFLKSSVPWHDPSNAYLSTISTFHSLTLSGLNITHYTCNSGPCSLSISSELLNPLGNLDLKNSTFTDITGNYPKQGSSLNISVRYKVNIESLVFRMCSNKDTEGYGAIYIVGKGEEIVIEKCTFDKNVGKGAGVYFETGGSLMTVKNCEFRENESKDTGGAIIIEKIDGFDPNTNTNIEIMNTLFEDNKCTIGTIYITDVSGPINIEKCKFYGNKCPQAAGIYIQNVKSASKNSFALTLLSSNFSNNVGESIIFTQGSSISTQNAAFTRNLGVLIQSKSSKLKDLFSSFTHNQAKLSYISLELDSSADFKGSIFTSNGGNVGVLSGSHLDCSECKFKMNTVNSEGGAVAVWEKGSVNMTNCTILENKAEYGAAIYFYNANSSSLNSTTVSSNSASKTAAIFLFNTALTMINTIMSENKAPESAGIVLNYGSLTISKCKFYWHSSTQGSFLSAAFSNDIIIKDSMITEGSSLGLGGALYLSNSHLSAQNTYFSHLKAKYGGFSYIYNNSTMNLTGCNIINSSAIVSGGGIYISSSALYLDKCKFQSNSFGAIYGVNLFKLELYNTQMFNNTSIYGAGIMCISCNDIKIYDSDFIANKAEKGGGAVFISHQNGQGNFEIERSQFVENIAKLEGGAIYVDNIKQSSIAGTFERNSAMLEGGAIYYDCSIECKMKVKNSSFNNNHAELEGGAIKYADKEPDIYIDSVLYANNSAVYGPDIASYPTKLSKLSFGALMSYPTGQLINDIISINILDSKNQIFLTDNSSFCTLQFNNSNFSFKGTSPVVASSGNYIFQGFQFLGPPGSSATLHFTSSHTDLSKNPITFQKSIYLRECISGEETLSNSCSICPRGEFNIQPGEKCQLCKEESNCLGGNLIYPREGYWRSDLNTEQFYKCYFKEACKDGFESNNLLGECETGYYGTLCKSCEKGYASTSNGECIQCFEYEVTVVYFVFLICFVGGWLSFIIISARKTAYNAGSDLGTYSKILVNYLSFISIIAYFNINWPKYILYLFTALSIPGNISEQIYAIECITSSSASDLIYSKLILAMSIPFASFFLIYLISLPIYFIKKFKSSSKNYTLYESTGALIVFLNFIYPHILKLSLSMLNCIEIEGTNYLFADLSIECWEKDHIKYSNLAIAILIIVIVYAGMLLYMLLYKRHRLDETENRLMLGCMYIGYKDTACYYEIFIIVIKTGCVAISVFFSKYSKLISGLSLFGILNVTMLMQFYVRPYLESELLNLIQSFALVILVITTYLALFFLTEETNDELEIVFFVVILILNIAFLSIFFWNLAKSVRSKMWFKKLLNLLPCKKCRRNEHSDHIEQEINQLDNTHVQELNIIIDEAEEANSIHTISDLSNPIDKLEINTGIIPEDLSLADDIIDYQSVDIQITDRIEISSEHLETLSRVIRNQEFK